jgi:hypothetical protein
MSTLHAALTGLRRTEAPQRGRSSAALQAAPQPYAMYDSSAARVIRYDDPIFFAGSSPD